MTSSDVRDVLNLPDGAGGPRPSKKARFSAPKSNLKGLAREVHSLGGDNPIAIVPEVTQFKKRRLANRKPAARWEIRRFRNSGRDDQDLLLGHWRRIEEPKTANDASTAPDAGQTKVEEDNESADKPDEVEDSAFAKFNVKIPIPQYTDDQYAASLEHSSWTREETDYLMQLARDFDLRWPLIWDRYDWKPPATDGEQTAEGDESKAVISASGATARTMEDLKARYYEIAAKMMATQKPVQFMSQAEFAVHEVMAHFNPTQEKLRKDYAIKTLSRSHEEAREEESLLLEIKRIIARQEKFNEDRRELYARLDYPHAENADISSFKSSAGLFTLLQNLTTIDKSKKRKSVMASDGVSPGAQQGTPAAGSQETARRDSNAAPAAPANGREAANASTTATPTGNKKGSQAVAAQSSAQATPAAERRKLTKHEEDIYGVAHFDRLNSGPAFRTEKINKLWTHKSQLQQTRIQNSLIELDVPLRLAMPCAATTAQYEQLLVAVNTLLDARKVKDKLDGEIKIEEARKAELQKEYGITIKEEQDDGQKDGQQQVAPAQNGEQTAEPEKTAKEEEEEDEAATPTAANGDNAAEPADGGATESTPAADTGAEEQDDEAAEKGPQPDGSGGAQKRSASVLSATSDQSSKRQKK